MNTEYRYAFLHVLTLNEYNIHLIKYLTCKTLYFMLIYENMVRDCRKVLIKMMWKSEEKDTYEKQLF